jgi:hypothetical protein
MKWLQKFRGRGAKAKLVKPGGDHIENLKAHPAVDIHKIGETGGLPVWVDVSPKDPTTFTYSGLLWEIEPMGEYIYYLAGEFPKNEKGLLRYGSAKTIAEVYVSFEDDVISVERSEMQRWSENARQEMTDSRDFIAMRVGQITAFAQERSRAAGYARHRALLALNDMRGGAGYMEQADDFFPSPWVRLLWSKEAKTSQGSRVTKVIVRSSDPDQILAPIHDLFETLIDRYQSIQDHPLSGAIRM